MKISKAIKVCRKLAKSALSDMAPAQRAALRAAKNLVERFEDELRARSEATSLRRAAAVIAGTGRLRQDAAGQLEQVADLAIDYLSARAAERGKDEASAVATVCALAWNIRAAAASVVRAAPRRSAAARAVRLA